MNITLYGIPNCDSVKKARAWLDKAGVAYQFHDYKKVGIDAAHLENWSQRVGWEPLLNRRGTTFRALPDSDKQNINQTTAIKLMIAQPSLIKRPVVEHPGGIIVGFDSAEFEKANLRKPN